MGSGGNNRYARRRREERRSRYFDYNLIVIVVFLLAFGLVMIYSTSSYDAYLKFKDPSYYFRKQLLATIMGLGFMVFLALVPYHFWERLFGLAYITSIVFIMLIIPFGFEANGAKRWIKLFGFSMQPAELAKIGMIIFLACFITKYDRWCGTTKGFFLTLLSVSPVCILLWLVTSNLSSAIIVAGIAVIMLFVSTPGYRRYILLSIGLALLAGLVVLIILSNAESAEAGEMGFRGSRILAWLDPEAYASGKGFQTLQALYAIGSGGLLGKGLGNSIQKLGFLPEAQNDMIFSIICEELGLFGALAVILLFLMLINRLRFIAENAMDRFGALLVIGVIGHIAIQVILNIAVVTNTIPNTGISLPFISYGGSATLFLLCEIGMCLSVARGIIIKDMG